MEQHGSDGRSLRRGEVTEVGYSRYHFEATFFGRVHGGSHGGEPASKATKGCHLFRFKNDHSRYQASKKCQKNIQKIKAEIALRPIGIEYGHSGNG